MKNKQTRIVYTIFSLTLNIQILLAFILFNAMFSLALVSKKYLSQINSYESDKTEKICNKNFKKCLSTYTYK